MRFKRINIIITDSLGVGALPDANEYGDLNSNTFKHISENCDLNIPNLQRLGITNIVDLHNVDPAEDYVGYTSKMNEISRGKDTMTGHWEIMGLRVDKPFITFTDTGFPDELIKELEEKTGRKVVGNKSASGTEILDELGEHQMKTGDLIVYTSADSVLQIAAHEDVIPLEELYKICKIAREMTLKDEWKVGRIIARPYVGEGKGKFKRTPNRHDYALKPFKRTVMNELKDGGFDVIVVGKINDIYDGEGVTRAIKTKSNEDGMNKFIDLLNEEYTGINYLNLVDFDAIYGHRRNAKGYGEAINNFDIQLKDVLNKLNDDDLLIITADHGNDPTHKGTDHTREYVPLVVFSPSLKKRGVLPIRETFADLGATIAENFDVKAPEIGESFLTELN